MENHVSLAHRVITEVCDVQCKAKVPFVHNANMNNEGEWRMRLGEQCSFPSTQHVLLCCDSVYEGISRPIKHSHSDRSQRFILSDLQTIRIQTNGITPILILCARLFVTFAFIIHNCSTHKWNLSFMTYIPILNLHVCISNISQVTL